MISTVSKPPRSRTFAAAATLAVAMTVAPVVAGCSMSGEGKGVSVDDGWLPDGGVSIDADTPAITKLDPALGSALREIAAAAAASDVSLRITSGWRSYSFQQQLFDEAVADYGSRELAAKVVATPDRSRHLSGHAVDIGPTDAAAWVVQHGASYGLCQIYANEMWHFELVADGECPDLKPDASAS